MFGTIAIQKRRLGEGYLVATSVVFIGILLGMLLSSSLQFSWWLVAPLVAVIGLVALIVWLHSLDLDGEHVWQASMYASLAMGVVTALLVGSHLFFQTLRVSPELTVVLTLLLATAAIGSVLVSVSRELHDRTRQLTLRNAVLYRVLRHNLRNDMTVVLAQLEDLKTAVDGSDREKIEKAERKIHALVELTDKVRQLNVMLEHDDTHSSIDLASTIERRVDVLQRTYPEIELDTDLPETASVYASEQFGLVVDNVVESALLSECDQPTLTVRCEVDDTEVTLHLEDSSLTLPEPDLSVIESGTVEPLEHGDSMELWIVYWLTERNDGELEIETDDGTRRISITLDRARNNDFDLYLS